MDLLTPQNELWQRLLALGWELGKIVPKGGQYVASGRNKQTGQDVKRTGRTPELALLGVLTFAQRAAEVRRTAALRALGAWQSDWLGREEDIARAYRQLPVFDRAAVGAWQQLAAESRAQAEAIGRQISIEVTDDPEPYESVAELRDDVKLRQKLQVSRAGNHPVWGPDELVAYRVAHDVLGYCQSGGDYTWRGENQAASTHMPMLSELAQEALFVESVARAAYHDLYSGRGPSRIGLMSEFLRPAQASEGRQPWAPHGDMAAQQQEDDRREDEARQQAAWSEEVRRGLPASPTFELPTVSDGWRQKPSAPFKPKRRAASWREAGFEEGGDEDLGPLDASTVAALKEHGIEFSDWQPKIGAVVRITQAGVTPDGFPYVDIEPTVLTDKWGRSALINSFSSDGGVQNPTGYVHGRGVVMKKDGTQGRQGTTTFMPDGGIPASVMAELQRVSAEHTSSWRVAMPVVRPKYVDQAVEGIVGPGELHEDPGAAPGEQYLCPNPKCRAVIEPDEAEYAMEVGAYHCPVCGGTFPMGEETFTRAGLGLTEMGEIGEQAVFRLGSIPGLGTFEPAHAGGNWPIDAVLVGEDGQRYGCEIKTNHSQAQERFKVGKREERAEKIAYCAANGLVPALVGVRLNFYTDRADVFFRPGLTDTWIGNSQMRHVATSDFSDLNPFQAPQQVERAHIPDQSLATDGVPF